MKTILRSLLAASCLFACSPAQNPDAGDAATLDMPTAIPDVPDRDGGGLFAHCRNTAQCGGGGLRCDTSYAGGLCVKACRSDRDCGSSGYCTGSGANAVCRPQCQEGADDCGPLSGLCFYFNNADTTKRACYPSCYEMPPADGLACNSGLQCNPWDGECAANVSAMGAENGDPCEQDSDCKSNRCIEAFSNNPAPNTGTGYLGGYCFSVGRRPDQSEYMRGMPMVRGNCPMGSVMIPYTGEVTGEPSNCVKECRMDNDCRAGYWCNRVFNGNPPAAVYTTGGCVPLNCIQPGRTCPAGTRCDRRMNGATAYGVCVLDGDAGSDAGTDASADVPSVRPDVADVQDVPDVAIPADVADVAAPDAAMDAPVGE